MEKEVLIGAEERHKKVSLKVQIARSAALQRGAGPEKSGESDQIRLE